MANKNRDKGNKWELTIINKYLKKLFPKARSSRSESRSEDANCIDICFTEDYAFQAKNYAVYPSFVSIFDSMKTNKTKVILFKHNKYRGDKGELAIIRISDLMEIIEAASGNKS